MTVIRPLSASLLAACCCLGLFACSESAAPPTASSAPSDPSGSTPATTAVAKSTAVTGVAECDQFLAAYEHCVMSKAPLETRDQLNAGLQQWKSSWKLLADNASTRDSLPQMCTQAREASTPGLKAYGCSL